ncbi:addiction module protein [Variovorax sp. RHLX14]|uniref:addiction module protein n=1 Tax=Variovorax sp. RHLX14 TaxID=1259731 RepID=UPI003F48D5C2
MPLPLETLEAEVLRLSPTDRSQLLDRVVASLDADKALDAAWDDEAARRDTEIDHGSSTLVSGRGVLTRLRAELG